MPCDIHGLIGGVHQGITTDSRPTRAANAGKLKYTGSTQTGSPWQNRKPGANGVNKKINVNKYVTMKHEDEVLGKL